MRRVYLDHSATTPMRSEVLEAMLPYLSEKFGNASSIHGFGREAKRALEESREKVARILGASPTEIYFTSGGTESDNLAVKGVAFANRKKGKHLITSQIEHHAILASCKFLQKEGFEVTYLPVSPEGLIDPQDLRKAIRDDTVLVSIMHVNNEVGTIQPIEELSRITRERQVYFHTDAVQSAGKVSLNVQGSNVDLISFSGHKIYGPKGVGALYIRKGTRITPWAHGGHHEHSKRAGTENVPGIVGFAEALELMHDEMENHNRHTKELADRLYKRMLESIQDVVLHGDPGKRVPNILSLSFKGIEGESVILSLDLKGVAIASGSACTSGTLEPSHVLSAMNVPPEIAQGALRFSFGKDNTIEDIDYVAELLPDIVQRLRSISPLYSNK
jgi:cysteine desulfurase